MIEIPLAALAIAAILQPNLKRSAAAGIFALVTLSHDAFLADLDGLAYYGSAGLADVSIILLLGLISNPPKLVIQLQAISLVSVVINFVGWVMWQAYLDPWAYNWAEIGVFTAAVVAMLTGGLKDATGRDYSVGGGRINIRGSIAPSHKRI